jgi:hypothetical protein
MDIAVFIEVKLYRLTYVFAKNLCFNFSSHYASIEKLLFGDNHGFFPTLNGPLLHKYPRKIRRIKP